MSSYQSPLTVIIKGAIAGAAGTAVMGAAMERAPQLMEQLGLAPATPPTPPRKPNAPSSPTEEVAERVSDRPLDPETRAAAGQAIHWAYGAGWGAFYGVMQSSLRLPHLLHGTLFGGLVYAVASTVVPRLGLTRPPTSQPMPMNLTQLAMHLIYGWATAIVFGALNFGRRG